MSGQQQLYISICLATYAVHMGSIPCWLWASGRGVYQQRSNASRAAPSEYEYWAVRLYFVMAIADGVRGIDGLYDTFEDGSFVSVWGRVTIGARFIAWWIRDLLGFLMILVFHDFTSRWTQIALGLPPQRMLIAMVRFAFVTGTVGFAMGLYGVLATNMQLWQVCCMLSVLPYNAMSCFACGRHIWCVIPRIAAQVPNDSKAEIERFVAASRATATRLLVAHAIMLSAFPALIHQKLATGGLPLVAHLPVGSWVGGTYLHVISAVPEMFPGKHPSPALEIVEITMGWLCLLLWWPLTGCGKGERGGGYVDAETMGDRVLALTGAASRAKKAD